MTQDQLHALIREALQEVTSEKQRRYMCALKDKPADARPEGLSQAEAEEMCKSEVEESFAMADPGVVGSTKKKERAVCPPGTEWSEESGGFGNCVKLKKESVSGNLDQIIFEETREFVFREVVQPHLTEAFLEDGSPVCVGCLSEQLFEATCDCPHLVYEAEYQGRKVTLIKPTRGDVKKFKVYVKDPKTGNVKKVNFGHGGTSAKAKGEKTMKIRKSNPKARKSFRARHNCDNPGPKTKARYWSCKKW